MFGKTCVVSDDVLVRTISDQIIHAKIIRVLFHELEPWIVVGSNSLKFSKGLYNRVGHSGSWVSGSVALKLEEGGWSERLMDRR